MILEDRDKAGVGLTSLSVDYVQLIARNLLLALNDKGAMGFINGSLMRLQDSIIGSALEHTKKKSLPPQVCKSPNRRERERERVCCKA